MDVSGADDTMVVTIRLPEPDKAVLSLTLNCGYPAAGICQLWGLDIEDMLK